MTRNGCMVVVGVQWGDEGKGKIVDVIAEDIDIVARYQGGANAGHTVYVEEEKFVLHQVPSGILHQGRQCLLGNGVVFDPFQFMEEVSRLEERGISTKGRIGVSKRAHLLLPYHKLLDQESERLRGSEKIGTTGRGIGPAYEDKIARRGIRLGDLANEMRWQPVVTMVCKRINSYLETNCSKERLDTDQLIAEIDSIREKLLSMAVDTGKIIDSALRSGRHVLLEGAQGSLLDVDHGTYPFVTSSTTTAGGAAVGVGVGPTAIGEVLGVAKAYTTRVGQGPLPTELESPLQDELRELGGEIGATTGRPRRCGWFDAVVTRYSARVNGLTGLAVTKLDILDTFAEIKIATAYEINGEIVEDFPCNMDDLQAAKPIYEVMQGWQEPTGSARSWEELPDNARAYLTRIEELTGAQLNYVSVGARRDQIIKVEI